VSEDKISLARFSGPDAKRRAPRYPAGTNPVRRQPRIEMVRRAGKKLGGLRTGSSHS